MHHILLFVLLLVFTAALRAQDAQGQDPTFVDLLRAKSLRCEFAEGTQASWDRGELKVERGIFGKRTEFTVYDSIDIKKGHARLVTSVGAGDIAVLSTLIGTTFIETIPNGGLNITTVFARRVKPADERLVAVMSKHVDINGPFPSQWHGTCRILE
jgi:hypothetical protein